MRRLIPPLVLLVAGSLSLTACNRGDTYSRPYTWHPTHANEANIAAEVADPSDLVIGRGTDSTPAALLVPTQAKSSGGLSSAARSFGSQLGKAMGTSTTAASGGTH